MGRIVGRAARPFVAALYLPFAGLALSACSGQPVAEATPAAPQDAVARHPVSNLRVIPVTVTSGAREHVFSTEVAVTPEAQARGLMFRTELPDDEAMLFPRDDLGIASFWMKNTPIPLDIVFIGPDRTILNIAAMTTPYSLDPVTAVGPTRAVLEIRGGLAEELGIAAGDKVDWQLVTP